MKNSITDGNITFISDSYNVEPWVLKFNDEGTNYFWRPADIEKLGTTVCFPLMGMLPEDKYILNGREYTLGMHGFAQDREFAIAEKSESHIVYELTDDEDSYARFPWRFRFQAAYFTGDGVLKTEYRIENRDDKELYFTVGGHPRFSCPIGEGSRFEDYYIEFEKPESVQNIIKSYGPISEIEKCFSDDGKKIRLDYSMFSKGCFCFHPINSGQIWLKNRVNRRGLHIRIDHVTHLQFWTSPDGPFLCIEPIYGSTSHLPMIKEDMDWKNRPYTQHIKAGEVFCSAYYVNCLR
jgi:galactose mutarotase-like enzyme